MPTPRVLLLRAPGTNCDREAQFAWEQAGALVEPLHVRALAAQPGRLRDFQVLTIPGGFSYGDDIAAGRILAAQIERHLHEAIGEFVDRGGLVLGICNGFQVLVKARLLPWRLGAGEQRRCTITCNDPPGFQDRWVTLRAADDTPCVFLEPNRTYEMPIAHGEGRVLLAGPDDYERLVLGRQDALRYVPPAGTADPCPAPYNPNGSQGDLAGICDPTGRMLGLMPHPERFVTWTQHPCWTSLPAREPGDGLWLFLRAVEHLGGRAGTMSRAAAMRPA